MRITVFGATGKTGKLVVEQALAAKHEVVAFARTPARLGIQDSKLSILQGDVLDAVAVERAVAGSDAVISVLAPGSNAAETVVTRGTRNIVAAMQKHKVKRLIVSTGAGVPEPGDEPGIIDKVIVALLKRVNKNVYWDMVSTVELVRQSDRDWTIVRVPMLTGDPPAGNIRVGAVGRDIGTRIGRADMAAFMLKQLNDSTYARRAPAISN